jgi:hypothetical protein
MRKNKSIFINRIIQSNGFIFYRKIIKVYYIILRILSFFEFSISMALQGFTYFTIIGPLHFDLSFPGNNWSQE